MISTIAASFGISDTITGGHHVDDRKNELTHQSNVLMKVFICIVSFLICFVLFYGTLQKKRKMIMAWVILMGIQCVLVLVLVVRLIYIVKNVQGEAKSIIGGILGAAIIELIICCYCWLVVWSRYLELLDEATAAANIHCPERSKLNDVNASSNC
ncbi:hypothetical protein CBL_01160 [Carabus blaptoides fortunei]